MNSPEEKEESAPYFYPCYLEASLSPTAQQGERPVWLALKTAWDMLY